MKTFGRTSPVSDTNLGSVRKGQIKCFGEVSYTLTLSKLFLCPQGLSATSCCKTLNSKTEQNIDELSSYFQIKIFSPIAVHQNILKFHFSEESNK